MLVFVNAVQLYAWRPMDEIPFIHWADPVWDSACRMYYTVKTLWKWGRCDCQDGNHFVVELNLTLIVINVNRKKRLWKISFADCYLKSGIADRILALRSSRKKATSQNFRFAPIFNPLPCPYCVHLFSSIYWVNVWPSILPRSLDYLQAL